jgi:hypothetical protein
MRWLALTVSQRSVLGIKKNIPNTVTVLGILFHEKNIPNTVTVLGILSLLSKTVLGILFKVYFIRNNIPIIKLAIKRYSKCHLFLGEKF